MQETQTCSLVASGTGAAAEIMLGVVRRRGLQACSHAIAQFYVAASGVSPATAAGTTGVRRLLSTSTSSSAPSPATAAAAQPQSQLHRGKKPEGEEKRIWPYLKAAKQQFFNVVLATLSIVMAVRMVEGKGARVALEEEMAELERRQGVLLRALGDKAWAEDAAKRIGAPDGGEALMLEVSKVVETSFLDQETAEFEAMRAAAAKASQEAAASTEPTKPGPSKGMM